MKEIELHGKYGEGKVAYVDDEDYEKVSSHRWHVDNCGYARCHEKKSIDPNRHVILMHRLIMENQLNQENNCVDHINCNKLDNRKENLRTCTGQQNKWNTNKYNRKNKGKSPSKYKGVRSYGNNGKWVARISINGIPKHIGVYNTEEEAALAYNEVAKKIHGEFVRLNKIQN